MSGILDAVGYVGDTLDKFTGGRAVRGVLNGRPREALSILPFSDSLGITDERQKSSGRDVLKNFGLTSDNDPLGGAKSFLAEAVLDPGTLIGGLGIAKRGLKGLKSSIGSGLGDDAMGLLGSPGLSASVSRSGRAPLTTNEIRSITGVNALPMGHDEANSAFSNWVKSLSPEEMYGIKAQIGSAQDRVAYTLRGAGSHDPFEYGSGSIRGEELPISSPEDVMSRVVPGLDSALSRGRAPRDMMTYRSADRIGDLNASNAESMIGKVVSDPSYLSTTIDPFGAFYGTGTRPRNTLFDILVPRGARSGYAGGISNWEKEKELILPRSQPLRVEAVRDIPTITHEYQSYRLDPSGRPMPTVGSSGSPFHVDDADERLEDLLSRVQLDGSFRVPDEWMAPGWEKLLEEATPSSQKLILMRALEDADSSFSVPGRASASRSVGTGSPGDYSGIRSLADFPMLKPGSSGAMDRIVGGALQRGQGNDGINGLIEMANKPGNRDLFGFYNKGLGGGAVFGNGDLREINNMPMWKSLRHERTHGMIDNAIKSGSFGSLPLPMRVPAYMRSSGNSVISGLGKYLDEAAAQGIQERGMANQLASSFDFLFGMSPESANVRDIYAKMAARQGTSPLATMMFQNAYRARDPLTYAGAGLIGNAMRFANYPSGQPQG